MGAEISIFNKVLGVHLHLFSDLRTTLGVARLNSSLLCTYAITVSRSWASWSVIAWSPRSGRGLPRH